jgi:pyruvate/2-oxoglutarate dehydrogenase complex dihydrolipoamide acyltransferase (E2) component
VEQKELATKIRKGRRAVVWEGEPGGTPGLVVAWLKEIGGWVGIGEKIAILRAESSEFSLTAPVQGALEDIFVGEGSTFQAGEPLATIRPVRGGT